MNNELKQFLDDIKRACLDNTFCRSCPYHDKEWDCCIFNVASTLWEPDKIIKIFEVRCKHEKYPKL